MRWSFACPDWEERLTFGRSLVPPLPLFDDPAQRSVKIFNKLRLPDVPGKPLMAEAAGDWFRDIVAALFGSLDPVTAERYVREIFCLVPKKNSKTTGGAGLMVTAMLMNERPRAELLFIGPTQAVSDLAFDQAAGMIEEDDYLKKRFHARNHLKTIEDRLKGSTMLVKSFDPKVLTGVKPAGVLIDELHEIAKSRHAARVIGQLRGGLLANPEAFLVFITTQSDEPPVGAFRAELLKARMIRDGKIAGAMLPILYEFPEAWVRSGRWKDPAVWPMVTPNLGRSIKLDRLLQEYETATTTGEEELRRWASQHLNIEIGLALQSDRWAGADFWEAQAEPALTLESLIERCEVIVVGIDGGGLDDLLGLTVIGREIETRRWLAWSKAWCHPIALERRKGEASTLQGFVEDGDLVIVDRLGEDIDEVADICEMLNDTGKLAKIGLDPVGIGAVVDALAEREIAGDMVVGISQGWKLSGAIKTAERKLADGTLWHAGARLMAWCVGNAKTEPRGNALMITKQISGAGKIDPLMAAFDAVALMSTNPEAPGRSIWDMPDAAE